MKDDRIIQLNDDIIRSAGDKRLYRCLELVNGLKITLVSDEGTDKAAASMDVHIGHLMDPPELPGLAHFCEHMVFLGTGKYPVENGFTQFLNEHSGSSNAFTSAEHTNYYFDVAPDSLQETLDRFAQFFIDPLFNADAKDREVRAIESENDNNTKSDVWRLSQLDKSTCDATHPYSKFGTGNLYTLDTKAKENNLDVREELLKFHQQYYSANLMALAVVGKDSLDDMTRMVVDLFSPIVNKNVPRPEFLIHPYGDEQVKTRFYVLPIKDTRFLELIFPLPDMSEHYASNPCYYLAHLIGHEGTGSLLSLLKSKCWANTIVAGTKKGAKGFMFFLINCQITEEGFDHLNDIVALIFEYLRMLRDSGPQEWIFKECKKLSEISFRFKDKEQPINFVTFLSGSLQKYPLHEVLCATYFLQTYRPDLINMVLERLRPELARLFLVDKKFEGIVDCTEEWYETQYKMEKIPDDLLQSWTNVSVNDSLCLPEPNEFIPTNFDLKSNNDKTNPFPRLIEENSFCKIWFKEDNNFSLPKACLCFDITSPFTYVDPTHYNMARLFITLVMDSLNEYMYNADLAGVGYRLDVTFYGMQIVVNGYNDKQLILLSKILDKITNFKIDPRRFVIIKDEYQRRLRNFKAEKPYVHASYYTQYLLEDTFWTQDELLDALDDITSDQVQAFIPFFLSRLYIEALLMGNLTQQDAKDIVKLVCETFQGYAGAKALLPSQLTRHRQIQLQDGCSYVFRVLNAVHPSSCIETYYQCGIQSTASNSLIELFCQVINEPCFDFLRTKEQLGYIVFSGVRRAHGAQGVRVLVQSDHDLAYVESRIEAFLLSIKDQLEALSEEDFKKHLNALILRKLEKPKTLSEESRRYFTEIVTRQYNFDRDNIEVNYLKGVTKSNLTSFYVNLILKDAPRRKKLAVYVLSQQHSEDMKLQESKEEGQKNSNRILIENPTAFKSGLPLYPHVTPYNGDTKSKL